MSAKIAPSQIQHNKVTQQAAFKSPNGPAPDGPGELVTVKAGDTLSKLAQARLGDAALWTEIAANNPQIGNPDKIWPGDQIRMPVVADKKLVAAEIADKTGSADSAEQVKNFAHKNDQAQLVAKKQTGQLNFLMNKLGISDDNKPATSGHAANSSAAGKPGESASAAAAGRDFSVDQAISQIKKQPRPLSARAMREAIVDGIGDRDSKAAGVEFKQLGRFVKKNWSKFSPQAQQVWGFYEKAALSAQKKGLRGISDKAWDKMLGRMDKLCAKEARSDALKLEKTNKNQGFNWGDVPPDARSPELQRVLTELRALGIKNAGQMSGAGGVPAQGGASLPGGQLAPDPQTAQMMAAQQRSGQPPFPDADTARLARGMGMKPPLSFEDMLFLMQVKYATNKEKEILQKMNELARGGSPQAQAPQGGASPQGAGAGSAPAADQGGAGAGGTVGAPSYSPRPAPRPQIYPQNRDYMQQKTRCDERQRQGLPPLQNAPQNPLPKQSQELTNMIMQRIGGAVEQFASPDSEGGEMISLNEMNKLVSLAKKLPPQQQQMLKAQAYQAAVTEGGLTTDAFAALMGYVNSQTGAAQATGPAAASAHASTPQAQTPAETTASAPAAGASAPTPTAQGPAYDPNADAVDLHKAMRGFGTDEKAIFQILQKRSADERKALRRAYKKLYGHNLVNELRGELSFGEEDRALKLLMRED